MTYKNAINKAIEALESCESGYYQPHFDEDMVKDALTALRALVADVPEGLGNALDELPGPYSDPDVIAAIKAATILATATSAMKSNGG